MYQRDVQLDLVMYGSFLILQGNMVALHLYDNGTENGLMETILLPKGQQGAWVYETVKNLDGVYYDYEVTVDGVRRRTADPYARAAGVNGYRSMVLDLRRTDPNGWDMDKAPEKTPEIL